jgi:hypothetical protein
MSKQTQLEIDLHMKASGYRNKFRLDGCAMVMGIGFVEWAPWCMQLGRRMVRFHAAAVAVI